MVPAGRHRCSTMQALAVPAPPPLPVTPPQGESLRPVEGQLADVMRNPGLWPLNALPVLGAAAFSGQKETVRSLVIHHDSKGVDETNEGGHTAGHAACANCQLRCLQVLQELGADLSEMDGEGRTLASCSQHARRRSPRVARRFVMLAVIFAACPGTTGANAGRSTRPDCTSCIASQKRDFTTDDRRIRGQRRSNPSSEARGCLVAGSVGRSAADATT
jgi:hypothetical protein